MSPIFLNRNLSYMRHRMSRSHKTRNTFKIDTMLAQKMKQRNDKANGVAFSGEYLTILFLGFFEPNTTDGSVDGMNNRMDNRVANSSGSTVQVETILLKISHNKRKDISSALMHVAVGKSDVSLNPMEKATENNKVPAISIATESFSTVGINQVAGPQLSFLLLFRVHVHTTGGNGYCSITNGDSYENGCSDDEPSAKRQKITGTTRLYSTELIIFDKYGRCMLKEGDYALSVQEISPHQQQLQKYNSPKKNSTWETINGDRNDGDIMEIYKQQNGLDDQNPVVVYDTLPRLKFRLQWTKEAFLGLVDRPEPILINVNNNEGNDKENYKPDHQLNSYKRSLNTNINNNSIHTSSVTTGHPQNSPPVDANSTSAAPLTSSSNNSNQGELNRYSDEPKIDHIIYQFIYNNNSRQQTEMKSDFYCPWCSLNCGSLYPLLKHLKLCHARFIFTYIPIPNGARIDVSINELYDGSYNGSPHDLLGTFNAFSRRGPVRRTSITNLLICRPRRQKHSITEFIECDENEFDSQRPFITGHNRMYHHTKTCLPVHPKELDIDSEGESDPLWLQHKTMQMIDEFTDVNEGEKELMKMWNLHVMKYGYVGDCQIPIALEMFIERRGQELLRKNLYRNFVLHMSSMFDFGLVSPEAMQKTIRKLQKILHENPGLQNQIRESRQKQMSYWNTVTIHKQAQPKTEKGTEKTGAGAYGTLSAALNKNGQSSGMGSEKKVKPTMTPAKHSSSTNQPAAVKTAISPPRRRSASAALHSNASSANNNTANNKDTSQTSSFTIPASNSSSYSQFNSSSSTSHVFNKRSCTTTNSAGSGGRGGSTGNSSISSKSSSITTRRKSLSVSTLQQQQQQRKRSLN
ncbi:polycomb protein suz12 isoform X2 [Uranotaenia lowii]|nr:polycomb protein suz12 isoform X2 [Uranotaenia lowii]